MKNEKKADNGEHYLACSVSGGHGNMTYTSGAILPVIDLRSPLETDLQLCNSIPSWWGSYNI